MDDNQKKLIEETFRKNTGKLIKDARKKKSWKQAYLADKVGVSPSVMSDIENGKMDMPLSRLAVISNILEMDSYLFKDDLLISEVLKALAEYGYKAETHKHDYAEDIFIPEYYTMRIFAVRKTQDGPHTETSKPTEQEDAIFNKLIDQAQYICQKEALLRAYTLINFCGWYIDTDLQTVARAVCRYAINVSNSDDRAWMKNYFNKCRHGIE